MTLAHSHPVARRGLLAAAFIAAGCSAGSHAGDPDPKNEVQAAREAAARDGAAGEGSPETKEIVTRLLSSEEGRILVNAIRAQGGWKAWRAVRRVSYTKTSARRAAHPQDEAGAGRAAAEGAASPEPGAAAAPGPVAIPAPASQADPAVESATETTAVEFPVDSAFPAGGFLDERFLFGLVFRLADPGLKKEYLGVELEAASNEYLEKLRVSREAGEGEEWLIACLSRSTWLLKRVIVQGADGKLTLVAFSDWMDAGGLRVPVERQVWALESFYAHWNRAVPDRVERLQDLQVVVSEAPPAGGAER